MVEHWGKGWGNNLGRSVKERGKRDNRPLVYLGHSSLNVRISNPQLWAYTEMSSNIAIAANPFKFS